MNEGLATLERSGGSEARGVFSVEVAALDEILGNRRVGLLKIDVEGHEPSVLAGAAQMLADGRVRDIVFEDHPPYPSEATGVLERAGYTLWSLANDLGGLVLRPPDQRGEVSDWPGPSYLATLDADRARARLEPRGWRVAGIGPPRIWPFRRAA
jgi:hypothetical protein